MDVHLPDWWRFGPAGSPIDLTLGDSFIAFQGFSCILGADKDRVASFPAKSPALGLDLACGARALQPARHQLVGDIIALRRCLECDFTCTERYSALDTIYRNIARQVSHIISNPIKVIHCNIITDPEPRCRHHSIAPLTRKCGLFRPSSTTLLLI